MYENSAPNNGMTIQVLDDQSIDLLDSYAKKVDRILILMR